MALILNEKYIHTKNDYGLFITNRILRIYPIYWIILTLTVLSMVFFHQKISYTIWDVIRNITLLLRADYFVLNTDFREPLILPQALTLVLEGTFYLIAPFIVRRNSFTIALLACASLLIRFITFSYLRLHHQPTGDWFFPGMAIFFLLGVLSYKLYSVTKKITFSKTLRYSFLFLLFSFTFFYYQIPLELRFRWIDFKLWIYLSVLALSIPFLFRSTIKSKLHGVLGDLSYPLYLCHLLVINTVFFFSPRMAGNTLAITVIAYSLIASLLLMFLVEKPIDTWRQRRISSSK